MHHRSINNVGLSLALLSGATFGTSGSFASSLLSAGWSPGAAVTARVTIAVREDADRIVCSVSDDGPGFPPGSLVHAFEPFYRAGSVPGRPGLGLALVRSVAEAHGGSTGILNRPGVGATFWLRVPA